MISGTELQCLERDVARALDTDDPSGLCLLGHGEISLVLGWPPDAPRAACKRLPPFARLPDFDAYARVVDRYIDMLRASGVRVVDTELRRIVRPDGTVVGFHVQPVLPADRMGPAVLRRSSPDNGHPLLPAVVDAVAGATTDRLGIDAQLANWVWQGDEVWQLDLTTPFLLDGRGRPAFDLTPFLAGLPAVVRPVVRRQMTSLLRRWTTARGALLDMAANVLKEHLDDWMDAVLAEVNRTVNPPVTRQEAARVNASDAHLWPLLLRLEQANRWWQRRVRHRPYEFLLPARTTYAE